MIDSSEKRNRQLAFELQNSHVCEKRSNFVVLLPLSERSTIILVEMFSDMCCLEDNVSRNCQTNTVARSV